MHKSILFALGEDALFAGASTPERVNIEHGVQVEGLGEDMTTTRDIATVEPTHSTGEYFTQNGKRYRLEALVQDNGVNKRFIVMEI